MLQKQMSTAPFQTKVLSVSEDFPRKQKEFNIKLKSIQWRHNESF